MATNGKLEPAAGYIRMSTDKQEDSPERQRMEIHKLAEAEGYAVKWWYEDLGMTGTESAKREGFQKLMADAAKRKFRTVLIHEPSRLSREHPLDVMEYLNAFRRAGVELYTSLRGKVNYNDIGGLLISVVDAHGAHDESIKIATRSVGGSRTKLLRGQRIAGAVFGYDREMLDAAGNVVQRVHFRERFSKPTNWTYRLVPSADVEAVNAVRNAFRDYLEGRRISHIVDEWNEKGITTTFGNRFTYCGVQDILKNAVYCGTLVAGRKCRGKFRRIDEEGMIYRDDAHDPIISRELFAAVQEEFKLRKRGHGGTVPARHLLSMLVECDHCGGRLRGNFNKQDGERYYRSPPALHDKERCPRPTVNATRLENVVLQLIRDHVLTPHNVAHISRVGLGGAAVGSNEPSIHARQLAAIREKITTAESNLALAESPSDFQTISRLIGTWREQAEKLARGLKRDEEFEGEQTETALAVKELSGFAEDLHLCERWRLSRAIASLIQRVVVGQRWIGEGRGRHKQWYGFIEFKSDLAVGTCELEDSDLAPAHRRTFHKYVEYIAAQNRPVGCSELMEQFKVTCGAVISHCDHAIAVGLLKKNGPLGGWVIP